MGGDLDLWTSFRRVLLYYYSGYFFGYGFLRALWNPNSQASHDQSCGTIVVRDEDRIPSRWRYLIAVVVMGIFILPVFIILTTGLFPLFIKSK
ncbi:MAG: hypothetical protein M1150_04010 [Patescibacteria group bacterium]|nr:hypothetical protein [Patescibacteria group bacterium]